MQLVPDDTAKLLAAISDPKLRAQLPAGMRNNNPGNIKYVGQRVPGIVGPSENTDQGDPQAVFDTPEDGMRAMYALLGKKYAGGKITANDMIAGKGGWTPGNFQAAANVARNAGIKPDQDINFSDPKMAARFMRGLMLQEHGNASTLYPDSMILSAISGGQPQSPALAAVNSEAAGVPANLVQSVNYVPPPFSNQQANFTPLIGDQSQPQSPAPAAPAAAPLAPVAAPDANQDPLKAWGVDVGTPAPEQAPVAPEQDVLKAWGVDAGEPTPAGDIAKSQAAKPDTRDNVRIDNVIRQSMGLPPLPVPEDASSTAEDVVKAGASGIARGTADLIGLPGTIANGMNAGETGFCRKATKPSPAVILSPEHSSVVRPMPSNRACYSVAVIR
jgi:hypothetical protein